MAKQRLVIFAAVIVVAAIAVVYGVPRGMRYLERRALSIQCRQIMIDIELCARLWAHEHDQRLPDTLLMMSNELVSPKILHCPADQARSRVRDWPQFIEANSSYEVVSPGVHDSDTNSPYLRCKVHGYVGYASATVRRETRR